MCASVQSEIVGEMKEDFCDSPPPPTVLSVFFGCCFALYDKNLKINPQKAKK